MKKIKLRQGKINLRTTALYLCLIAGMVLLNFALPYCEPLAFALLFAALSAGLNPYLLGAGYLVSAIPALSLYALLSAGVQAAFLILLFAVYHRCKKKIGLERVLYAALAQLPFIFLFPHAGYELLPFAPVLQKVVLAAFIVLLSFLFESGLGALLYRVFRCRLPVANLVEICLLCVLIGLGVLNAFPRPVFIAVSLFALLFTVLFVKNASALCAAIVVAAPLAIADSSLVPIALYCLYSAGALLFVPYGKTAPSLALAALYLCVESFTGLYLAPVTEIVFTLLACLLPVLIVLIVPEKCYAKLNHTLLFYKERSLPRIAVNRNRRQVGQQLYEVSSLFREIEAAFEEKEAPDDGGDQIREKLVNILCTTCPHRRKCEHDDLYLSLDKLVAVGKAKGRVNLIDLPKDVTSHCTNTAGMLFSLNKLLAQYRRCVADIESAREGRKLLARQAHGVSEILRDIALEQSEEYLISDGERKLSRSLSAAGFIASEIFLYGEGANLTVSVTLPAETNAKKLVKVASHSLKTPLALAEKIPLTAMSACYVLKRKANFDAAFGIASRPKNGETASGDTHSVMKIDERRFLVALSDGMGSGEEARSVSDRALSLLESFYKAKMPSDTVLDTVNKLIAFSSEEKFSCLDLAAVNLDTGNADIVKIGSPAGYLLSGEELRVLEGESLPMGMLEAVHPATMQVTMKENDFLVFLSDGVSSAFGSSADLLAYLSALRPLNPQSLAEEVLKNALDRYHGKAEDDMTVVAVKLMKSA
ncbi:MAG: SpoIIE family protein phosphatase [Clostridia bacterium]|nr:SpoIIE family protein phosphatase [Clostridia bacterium]